MSRRPHGSPRLARAPWPWPPRRRSSPAWPSRALLLLGASPALAASPLFLVHGSISSCWPSSAWAARLLAGASGPRRWARAARRAGAALGAATASSVIAGGALTSAILGAAGPSSPWPRTPDDADAAGRRAGGAAVLPVYQAGLLLALGLTAFAGGGASVRLRVLLLAGRASRGPRRARGPREAWPRTRSSCARGRRGAGRPHSVMLRRRAARAGALAPPLRPAADGAR
jgi:hypothetical protein